MGGYCSYLLWKDLLKVIQMLLYSMPCSYLGLHTPHFGALDSYIYSISQEDTLQ